MSSNKVISVSSSLVSKKAPDCKEIPLKAIAGVAEEEIIERYTIGSYGADKPTNGANTSTNKA